MIEQREIDRFRRQLAAMLSHAAGAPVAGGSVPADSSGGDPEAFAQVVELLTWAAGDGLREAAEQLRQPHENTRAYSWADIGRALGMNRQSAWERFRTTGAGR